MTRLSAHLGYLYAHLPLADRLAAAARDGFTAVEHPEPWAIPARDMAARLSDLGLRFVQVTSGMGGAPGEKGLAAQPGRETAFRDGFRRALDYALAVGAGFVHPLAGTGGDRATYRGNLDWAIRTCEGHPVRVLVEAISIPGYHLAGLSDAAAVQDAAGGRLAVLLDSYHAAAQGTDPVAWTAANGARIGHVHIADHPGRHEPGTGTLDFPRLLAALQAAAYAGAIGFEYMPSTPDDTAAGTGFLPGWKARLATPVA